MQTAVIRGVLDDHLMRTLGLHKPRGWEVRQLVPSAWRETGEVRYVTHWTVVLESDRPLPPEE